MGLSLYQWISLAQWALMSIGTVVLWRMRTSVQEAVDHAETQRRLKTCEDEIERTRKWRHDVITPWQTELVLKLDDRYVMRREHETPPPQNRDRNRRG